MNQDLYTNILLKIYISKNGLENVASSRGAVVAQQIANLLVLGSNPSTS